MTSVSLLTNFIDDIVTCILIAFVTIFLKKGAKKTAIVNDILVAVVVGIIGVFFRSLNLIIWILSSIFYQKLRHHRLNYEFLNRRLFAIVISYLSIMISDRIETLCRFMLRRYNIVNISNDAGTFIYIILYILIATVAVIVLKKSEIYSNLYEKITDSEISQIVFRILLFLVISFVTILLVSQIAQITAVIQIPLILIFIIFIGLTLIELFTFIKSYSYKKDAETQIVQNQQLKEYLNNIEQQYQDIRRFKHDYNNMLLALEEFTKKK